MATQQQIQQISARLLPDTARGVAPSQTNLLLARVMCAGTVEELNWVTDHFGKNALRDVLAHPPAGIFDRESWLLWHSVFGLSTPAMPDDFFAGSSQFESVPAQKETVIPAILPKLEGFAEEPVDAEPELQNA